MATDTLINDIIIYVDTFTVGAPTNLTVVSFPRAAPKIIVNQTNPSEYQISAWQNNESYAKQMEEIANNKDIPFVYIDIANKPAFSGYYVISNFSMDDTSRSIEAGHSVFGIRFNATKLGAPLSLGGSARIRLSPTLDDYPTEDVSARFGWKNYDEVGETVSTATSLTPTKWAGRASMDWLNVNPASGTLFTVKKDSDGRWVYESRAEPSNDQLKLSDGTSGTDYQDQFFECFIKIPVGAEGAGFIVRQNSDATDGYLIVLKPADGTLILSEQTAITTFTTLSTYTNTTIIKPNKWLHVGLMLNSTRFIIYLNGKAVINTTNSSVSAAGKFVLYSNVGLTQFGRVMIHGGQFSRLWTMVTDNLAFGASQILNPDTAIEVREGLHFPVGPNLLTNGGFETGTTSSWVGTGFYGGFDATEFTVKTSAPIYAGTYAVYINGNPMGAGGGADDYAAIHQDISIDPRKLFYATGKFFIGSHNEADFDYVVLQLLSLDSSNNVLQTFTSTPDFINITNQQTADIKQRWVTLTTTTTETLNPETVKIRVLMKLVHPSGGSGGSGDEWRFDNLELHEILPAYSIQQKPTITYGEAR